MLLVSDLIHRITLATFLARLLPNHDPQAPPLSGIENYQDTKAVISWVLCMESKRHEHAAEIQKEVPSDKLAMKNLCNNKRGWDKASIQENTRAPFSYIASLADL